MEKDLSFAESKGMTANEHAKKLAKEKSKAKKPKYESVYTSKGFKVLKVTFKANGQYQEYVGSLSKKKEAQMLKTEIANWKKLGIWVDEHSLEEYAQKKIAALNK
jgi:hypothetical protein